MKKKILFFFSIMCLLVGCDNVDKSNTSINQESQVSTSVNESISNKDSSTSTNNSESSESKDETLSDTFLENVTINYLDVPSSISGQYAPEGIYKENKISLYCYNVMQNTGKFADLGYNTIQMKKEGSYVANVDAIRGVLSITMMKIGYFDYSINEQVNSTIVPTVTALRPFAATTEATEILHGEITKEDENTITYTFNDSIEYVFFSIQNDSSYAQYLLNIAWQSI